MDQKLTLLATVFAMLGSEGSDLGIRERIPNRHGGVLV